MPLGRGLIVAAPASGVGKTTVTIGLQRALIRRGLRIAGAKCGPDYIDPAFHEVATGRPSINLDGFAMEAALLRGLAADAARNVDLVIAEGAMGLFDGARDRERSGTAAEIARLTGWPILLVVDGAAAAQSVAAVAHGCATFPGAPSIVGVIVNRVASDRHAALVRDGFGSIDLPVFGTLRRADDIKLPSRHLGLIQVGELLGRENSIEAIADAIEAQCDLDAIIAAAGESLNATMPPVRLRPPGQRIAVAQDAAFSFLYPHVVRWWREAGAETCFFSPLADQAPPIDCDTCWLPGGYPELHAAKLADNSLFLEGLRAFAVDHPVHGECGGYMMLGRTIEDASGTVHRMAGLLPVETSFAHRCLTLGYRRAAMRRDTAFAPAGQSVFGHEFHYATVVSGEGEGEPLADVADAEGGPLGPAGHRSGHVTGSFFHLIA